MAATRATRSSSEAVRTGGRWALFESLLARDHLLAAQLLESGPEQFAHEGPGGITTLHVAAAQRMREALEALVAAGSVPLDRKLDLDCWEVEGDGEGCLKGFLIARGVPEAQFRPPDSRCIRLLLEAGADANVGAEGATPFYCLCRAAYYTDKRPCAAVVEALLDAGANPLRAFSGPDSVGTLSGLALAGDAQRFVEATMGWLTRRREEGLLRFSNAEEALELLSAAAQRGHDPLALHALAYLPTCRQVFPDVPPNHRFLTALLHDAVRGGSMRIVAGMLKARPPLPFDLALRDRRSICLLEKALSHAGDWEGSEQGALAMLRLLCRAGAPVTLRSLLRVCASLQAGAVAVLLAQGYSAAAVCAGFDTFEYYCPVHSTLLALDPLTYDIGEPQEEHLFDADLRDMAERTQKQERAALAILEMLREAGYRPAVFHNMAPPWFLRLGNTPVARPDPFDHYSPHVSPRALFVAKGGSWSPATHRLWPDSFKAAVRTMLLAASGSGKRSGGGSGQLNLLAVLPPDALQRVIELASPLSAWV